MIGIENQRNGAKGESLSTPAIPRFCPKPPTPIAFWGKDVGRDRCHTIFGSDRKLLASYIMATQKPPSQPENGVSSALWVIHPPKLHFRG